MNVKIVKYKDSVCCCSVNVYLFYIRFLNDVYEVQFELGELKEILVHDIPLLLKVNKNQSGYKVNLKIEGVSFNFDILEEELNKWNNISYIY